MPRVHSPKTEEELADLILTAKAPFRLQGLGSKPTLGNPVTAPATLSLARFSGIALYEPEELILEAGAATPLSDIEKRVHKHGQMLAFEPPDYSALLGTEQAGSLGGILATALSGPRRIKAGAVRDHVLGFRGVTGRGEIIRAGARVVKNVTGYDLPKLAAGSHGSLAALTSVIFKVVPRPETEETLLLRGLDDATAIAVMADAMQSPADVSAAAHVPNEGTFLRLEGFAASVAYRRDRLVKILGQRCAVLPDKTSRKRWREIRDAKPLWPYRDHAIWRLSVTPTEGAATAARIATKLDCKFFLDWAGGLIWLAVAKDADAGAAAIRASLTSGHATLIRAPEKMRERVEAFQPQPPALAALSRRVKEAFDPNNLLNPGIMART